MTPFMDCAMKGYHKSGVHQRVPSRPQQSGEAMRIVLDPNSGPQIVQFVIFRDATPNTTTTRHSSG